MATKPIYLTVSDLNYYITQKFKRDPYLHKVYLQGELSNFRLRRNSHQYFSLKDEHAKINVVMFRSYFDKVKFRPEEGMKVFVTGYVSVYAQQGSYQFYAETMEPAGLGALYEQLQQLKDKLSKEGLFDQAHKRALPRFPDKIAVITSASGAVIHDIMVTCNRRFPYAEVDLYPAKVQGEGAKETLVQAMQQVADSSGADVLIIGRGGGSLEDLWPFNEEAVVRQVYAMPMPVISSVGHETDTTLCDLAADQRAATPTAAAEYATPNLPDELNNLKQLSVRLVTEMQSNISQRQQYLRRLENSVVLRQPERIYDQAAQSLDLLTTRLQTAMSQVLQQRKQAYQTAVSRLQTHSPLHLVERDLQQTNYLQQRLNQAGKQVLADKQADVQQLAQKLDAISPLKTLSRGFAIATNEQQQLIASVEQLKTGQVMDLQFKDGTAQAEVTAVKSKQK
ncbi:MAG: exodeoxyribonuclease VII large subunit [Lactobacillus sp.]|jgi:exodeoxyribonuclease VII large subunit|nr:exodeoxyribonuclease VII large subunit [Lactobacillus sp.]MCH3906103.1 exodeoxyribonuclease VII large subunit [Lactobacillus sp.]MCH3990319.1 exodeoxyribonuclease VII large subunit [Lactobacillus sp.]MCH4068966.1 exodeoxyribonuclease VII large subunit [Lactobacillus sp.]MCI1303368.1 exodeoxyribonuclease VII large subunit [Lactobacillus sp.]